MDFLKNKKLETRSVLFRYSAFQFFFSLLLWLPIFYEYQKRIGLNDTQIFQIQSFYYLVFCLLEIPTGLIADFFGYRNCLRLGALSLVLANLFPIFEQSYTGFLTHFFLIALSRSFISGASSAYLYSYLSDSGRSAEYKKIEGVARAYSLIGKIICFAVVGSLMSYKLSLPYWLTSLSALISLYFATLLPDLKTTGDVLNKKINIWSSLRTKGADLLSAIMLLFKNSYLLFVVLQGVGIFVLVRIVQVNLFQPILESKSFPLWSFGMVMALMTLFEALGSAFPKFFQLKMKDRSAVTLMTVLMALCLMAIAFLNHSLSREIQVGVTLLALSLFALASGVSFPIQKQLMNDAIDKNQNYRATLLSVESLVDRAVCAWVATLLGSALEAKRLDNFLFQSSFVTLLVFLLLSLAFEFAKRRRMRSKPKTLSKVELNEGVIS